MGAAGPGGGSGAGKRQAEEAAGWSGRGSSGSGGGSGAGKRQAEAVGESSGSGGCAPPRGVWGDGSPQEQGGSGGDRSHRGVRVGTSGWQYRDWRGTFYPPDVPQRRWLEYYASQFATVENNGTFYRLPPRETFAGWRERVGDDFVMTIKASRYLTHVRRLRDPAEPVRRLLDAAAGLGDRHPWVGPVLLQLPPDLQAAPQLLDECLGQFPAEIRVAVEPRHESWWTGDVRDVLAARNAALCWADRKGSHGHPAVADGRLGLPAVPRRRRRALAALPRVVAAVLGGPDRGDLAPKDQEPQKPQEAEGLDVYVYFNNDQGGAAPRDGAAFAAAVARHGSPP